MSQAQNHSAPYTPPTQYTNAQQGVQSTMMPDLALPPDLQGLNLTPQQLGLLFSHFQAQSGAVTFPPPPPFPLPVTTASLHPHMPLIPPESAPLGPQPAQTQNHASAHMPHNQVQRVVRSDREDGELSDAGHQHALYQPSTRSKKRKYNVSTQEARRISDRASDHNSAQTNGHSYPHSTSSDPRANASQSTKSAGTHRSHTKTGASDDKRSQALRVIAVLHEEGFSFNELLQEGLNPSMLRSVYHELHIPIAAAEGDQLTAPNAPNDRPQEANSAAFDTTPPSLVADAPKPVPAMSPASAAIKAVTAAPPVDRQSYLARLQAAKNKKLAAASPKPLAQAPAPAHAPVTITAPVPTKQSTDEARTVQTATPPQTVQSRDQPKNKISGDAATELIRKKMEALKAVKRRQEAKQPITSTGPPAQKAQLLSEGSVHTEQQRLKGSTNMPTRVHDGPVSDGPSSQSGAGSTAAIVGIPGLFMAAGATNPTDSLSLTESSLPATMLSPDLEIPKETHNVLASEKSRFVPTSTLRSTSASNKRPVAADLNDAYVPPEAPPYRRPFGRSRQNSSDDAMIIEVSDDEGGNLAEEPIQRPRQKNIRDLPPLRDFPQRSAFNKAGNTQGTPTPSGTPGAASEVEELRRKEREIRALQLRIQEFERRKRR